MAFRLIGNKIGLPQLFTFFLVYQIKMIFLRNQGSVKEERLLKMKDLMLFEKGI